MEKRISVNEFRSAVRVAQACNPLIIKRDSFLKKIEKLKEEYETYDAQVKALESGIVSLLGISVEDMVKKEVVVTGTDSNGKVTKATKYLPTDNVTFDAEKKQYIVSIPEKGQLSSEENVPTVEEAEAPAETVEEATEMPASNDVFQFNN